MRQITRQVDALHEQVHLNAAQHAHEQNKYGLDDSVSTSIVSHSNQKSLVDAKATHLHCKGHHEMAIPFLLSPTVDSFHFYRLHIQGKQDPKYDPE